MIRTGVITLAAVASLALVAGADTLRLRNGGAVEGRVTETDTGYVLRTETGSVTFEKDEVREWIRARTALEDILDAIATLPPDDAAARFALATRARAAGCESTALDLLRQTLALDPSHEGAHLALGDVKKDGRWMSPDEARVAAGEVKFEGEWRSKAEMKAILAERRAAKVAAETEEARAEAARARAEQALAEARMEALERREAEERIQARERIRRVWVVDRPCDRPFAGDWPVLTPVISGRSTDDRFVEPSRDPYAAPWWVSPVR